MKTNEFCFHEISSQDYRQRVLSRFGDRCTELYLDNEKAEGSEIDMALVLAALRQSEAKPRLLQTSFVSESSGR